MANPHFLNLTEFQIIYPALSDAVVATLLLVAWQMFKRAAFFSSNGTDI